MYMCDESLYGCSCVCVCVYYFAEVLCFHSFHIVWSNRSQYFIRWKNVRNHHNNVIHITLQKANRNSKNITWFYFVENAFVNEIVIVPSGWNFESVICRCWNRLQLCIYLLPSAFLMNENVEMYVQFQLHFGQHFLWNYFIDLLMRSNVLWILNLRLQCIRYNTIIVVQSETLNLSTVVEILSYDRTKV